MPVDRPITDFAALDQAIAEIYDAWNADDSDRAEALFRRAWDDIPDPKGTYEVAQFVANDFIDFLSKTGQHAKAMAAIPMLQDAYAVDEGEDPHVDFVAATVAYDSGNLADASRLFGRLVAKYGKRPFAESDPKYYEFATKGR